MRLPRHLARTLRPPDTADLRRQQTIETVTTVYNGKLRLERRNANPTIHARTFLHGKTIGKSTGETTLAAATKVATDWYLKQLDAARNGQLHSPLFSEMVEKLLLHLERQAELSDGQRKNYRDKWTLLKPFFENIRLTDIDSSFLTTLREQRAQMRTSRGAFVRPATLKKDFDFVRVVLRYAKEWEKCFPALPQFPSFRGPKWTCTPAPRPFLTREQYHKVCNVAKAQVNERNLNPRTKRQRQELWTFIRLSVAAALRVDEAYSLRFKDCEVMRLNDRRRTPVVHMKVLGKHSRGCEREDAYALGHDAVRAFVLLKKIHPEAKLDDVVFREQHREGMKKLLNAVGLRSDAKTGRTRDSKSLRPTGISLRLDESRTPSYRDVAKWARTSPAMIFAFYDQTHREQSAERIVAWRVRR
jgi:hypothetical protein